MKLLCEGGQLHHWRMTAFRELIMFTWATRFYFGRSCPYSADSPFRRVLRKYRLPVEIQISTLTMSQLQSEDITSSRLSLTILYSFYDPLETKHRNTNIPPDGNSQLKNCFPLRKKLTSGSLKIVNRESALSRSSQHGQVNRIFSPLKGSLNFFSCCFMTRSDKTSSVLKSPLHVGITSAK